MGFLYVHVGESRSQAPITTVYNILDHGPTVVIIMTCEANYYYAYIQAEYQLYRYHNMIIIRYFHSA